MLQKQETSMTRPSSEITQVRKEKGESWASILGNGFLLASKFHSGNCHQSNEDTNTGNHYSTPDVYPFAKILTARAYRLI
jgi:hypothetical protein